MRDTIRKSANRYDHLASLHRRVVAADLRMSAQRMVAANALRDNRCPTCHGPVRQNLALTGWVQCSQFGARDDRTDRYAPPCEWQGFTV